MGAKPLQVNPVDLHMSADHMDMHHMDLQAAHAAADGDIESAQTGWTGASAAALQAKLTEWQTTTETLCASVGDHGDSFRVAGHNYDGVDVDGGENIDREIR